MFVVAFPFPMLGSHFPPREDTMFWPGGSVIFKVPGGSTKARSDAWAAVCFGGSFERRSANQPAFNHRSMKYRQAAAGSWWRGRAGDETGEAWTVGSVFVHSGRGRRRPRGPGRRREWLSLRHQCALLSPNGRSARPAVDSCALFFTAAETGAACGLRQVHTSVRVVATRRDRRTHGWLRLIYCDLINQRTASYFL